MFVSYVLWEVPFKDTTSEPKGGLVVHGEGGTILSTVEEVIRGTSVT